MTRDEFERIVRKMQDDNVALTMANLMIRTELPRAQIEQWLDEMQRDNRSSREERRGAEARKSEDGKRRRDGDDEGDGDGDDEVVGGLFERAQALKRELMGEALKQKLGVSTKSSRKPKRHIKQGAVLGAVLPPAGLAYSAPVRTAVIGTVMYAVVLALTWMLPMIAIPYLLIPFHLVGGVLGAGYAWRFNRAGERTPLLPGGGRSSKSK